MNKSPTVGCRNALHKSSHDEYYEKRGTTDKTKHKPNIRQARCSHAFGIHESRQTQVSSSVTIRCKKVLSLWQYSRSSEQASRRNCL